MAGVFWGGGVLVAFGSSRCLGRGGVLVEGVFWCWLKVFGGASLLMDGGGVLVEGAFGVGGVLVEGVFRWRRCVGGGGVLVLVEGAFWWSEPFNGWRGRFGGRSILMEGRFGGGRAGWVGRGFKVQKYSLEIQK